MDPTEAHGISDDVVGLYQAAELALLTKMADHLAVGVADDDWSSKQQIEQLKFRREAQAIARQLQETGTPAVGEAVRAAGRLGRRSADDDLRDNGVPPEKMRPSKIRHIPTPDRTDRVAQQAMRDIWAVNNVVAKAADGLYVKVKMQVGARTAANPGGLRVDAVQQALDVLTARGVTGFRDSAGRNWGLANYLEMKSRTVVNQELIESHTERMKERGYNLLVVSSHSRPAPQCQPFEGQVLSLDDTTGTVEMKNATGPGTVRVKIKATLKDARTQGFQHPNCRHAVSAYIPGASRTFTTEPDPEGYEATQRTRAMERAIRETKRKQATAVTPEAKRALAAKLRAQQKAIREHVGANGLKRRPRRERIDLGYDIGDVDPKGVLPTPKPAPVPPKPASTFLSPSTRDLVDNARSTLPKTRADWLDTTLRYPTDKNGAKLVPEKLQRHLDTTLNVGKAIRADAVKRIDSDAAIRGLLAEEKKLVDSAQWLSPRRAEIQREIVRREQSIIREALNEVRPFGGVRQAARLKAVVDGNVSPGTSAALSQLRSAEAFFPADWLRAASARGELTVGTSARAFFQAGSDGDLLAAASTDELPSYRGAFTDYPEEVMVHELGHRMEQAVDGLTQLEYALVRSRSIDSNGVLEPVTKIYDGEPGLEHEVGYEDRWKSKYAGKTYATDAAADPARSSMEAFQVGLQDTLGRGHRGGEFDESGQLQEFVIGVLALL